MADIEFLPVCSCCGKQIKDFINCAPAEPDYIGGYNHVGYMIEPSECPHCGSLFHSIRMPTRLPFDNRGGASYWDD